MKTKTMISALLSAVVVLFALVNTIQAYAYDENGTAAIIVVPYHKHYAEFGDFSKTVIKNPDGTIAGFTTDFGLR